MKYSHDAMGNLTVRQEYEIATWTWRWNPARAFAWGLRKILPLLGERAGVRVSAFLDSFYFTDLLKRHDGLLVSRLRLRPCAIWQQAISVLLIPILILATTPNAEAATFHPVFYYYHGDHLGSSSVLTDRAGERVQHYEYTAFGNEGFKENTSAFALSHRYTGQILDDETGLYYYGARYYDPELGRFAQADTIVPSAANPQTLNRYAYCGNNPLKYVDPSGHDFGLSAIIIGVVIGAAIGGATAAATGGNIGMGILTGAIGGLFGGIGAGVGQAIGTAAGNATLGAFAGSVVGGAAGGAVSAAVTGGDIGMGALTGAIAGGIGFGVNQMQLGMWDAISPQDWVDDLTGFASSAAGGALGGGIGAVLQGGDFWDGAAAGAIGGAIGYGIAVDLPDAIQNPRPDHLFLGKAIDALAAITPDWLTDSRVVSFGAGLGDALSLGATRAGRKATGIDDVVNYNGYYAVGQATGAVALSVATAGATTGGTAVGAAANVGKAASFTKNQQALLQLGKQAARTGVTRKDAATLLRWGREVNRGAAAKMKVLGHSRATHWQAMKGQGHIHIGGQHIPVIP